MMVANRVQENILSNNVENKILQSFKKLMSFIPTKGFFLDITK